MLVELTWGWPNTHDVCVDEAENPKDVIDRIAAYCQRTFKHFNSTPYENDQGDWTLNTGRLSFPERDKVWDFCERQGFENGEA